MKNNQDVFVKHEYSPMGQNSKCRSNVISKVIINVKLWIDHYGSKIKKGITPTKIIRSKNYLTCTTTGYPEYTISISKDFVKNCRITSPDKIAMSHI